MGTAQVAEGEWLFPQKMDRERKTAALHPEEVSQR
jgi:hypothetical protein